jgi:TetR/AcrR family tetracycline transcriptional repressor
MYASCSVRGRLVKEMPPTARLSRDQIADAALRVARSEGIDAVTFRRVAKDLGAAPMALYRHVRDQHDLWQAMVDRGGMHDVGVDPVDDDVPWGEQLRALLLALYRRAHEERELVALAMRLGVAPRWEAPLAERLCQVIIAGGADPARAHAVARFAVMSMMSIVHAENWRLLPDDTSWAAARKAAATAVRALPPEEFPALRAVGSDVVPRSRVALAEQFVDLAVMTATAAVADARRPRRDA